MKPAFTAIFTDNAAGMNGRVASADLFVIFAHRDEKTAEDIAGTQSALEAEGYGVRLLETDDLANIGNILVIEEPKPEAVAQPAWRDDSTTVGEARDAGMPLAVDTVAAIHQCLKLLAGHCDGARTLDGAGFNKLDAQFGRSLAEAPHLSQKQAFHGQKLIRKYHNQLPADLLQAALTESSQPAAPLTPVAAVNQKYRDLSGDTYQNGVTPGPKKLAQFREVLELMGTPKLYAQENAGDQTMVYVKLFDPSSNWTWYITEFSPVAPDGCENLAFGLVDGHEPELGYIDLTELAAVKGARGIGIEIDTHFAPCLLTTIRETLQAKAN